MMGVKSKMDGRRKNGRDGCFPMDGGKEAVEVEVGGSKVWVGVAGAKRQQQVGLSQAVNKGVLAVRDYLVHCLPA
jgi:hypothetical protein